MWWRQFTKEVMAIRGELLLIAGALAAWTLFLLSRAGMWATEVIMAIYWLPTGFLPLWALWTSVQLYRQEWRENTSYLLLSLPVRAWKITSAKLAVILAGLLGFSLLALAGGVLLAARTGLLSEILGELRRMNAFALVPRDWVMKMALLGYGSAIGSFLVVGLVAQFAYVFSRLFSRLRGLVMVWTWLLVFWAMGRVSQLGGWLLAWLPDFHVRVLADISGGVPQFETVRVDSGPIVATALCVIGVYVLLNFLLERAVEV